jgi:hypothetical protein
MLLNLNFLIFTKFGAVQKEIEGILSPNNIWPRVFLFPWEQKIGSRLPIMMSQSPVGMAYDNNIPPLRGFSDF